MNQKHSELGILSFCISCITIVLYMGDLSGYDWIPNNKTGSLIILGLPFLPLVLGIVGLIQKNRRKELTIAGIVLSILIMIVVWWFVSIRHYYPTQIISSSLIVK
jgi:Na+/proline symporter